MYVPNASTPLRAHMFTHTHSHTYVHSCNFVRFLNLAMHIEVHSARDSTFGSKATHRASCCALGPAVLSTMSVDQRSSLNARLDSALTPPPKPCAPNMASTIKVPVPRAKQEPCQETPMSGKVPVPMAVKSGMPRQPRSLNHAGIVSDDEHWGHWAPPVSADDTADSENHHQSWPGFVDPTPLQDTRTPCLSHSRRLTPYVESRFGGA